MKNKFLFIWCFLFVIATEITDYFIKHNMVGIFNIMFIELMFLWLGIILDNKLKQIKKGQKK